MTTTKMSVLRITAVAAALATAAVGAVATTDASAHAANGSARAGTSISIRAQHPSVQIGKTDAVLGNLHVQGVADAAGRDVTLEAKPAGQTDFTPVGTDTAGPHGGLSLSVAPEVTTRYRWHYAGAADARPRTSGTATIRIRTQQHPASRLPTTLSVRAVHRLVDAQGDDTVRGKLRSRRTELPHRTVVLLSHPSGTADNAGWQYAGSEQSDPNGEVSFTVSPDAATTYRLQFLGTEVFRPSHSGIVRVGVRPSMTIAATPRRLDPGQSTTVTGVASDDGAPIVGATVDLLARTAAKHQTFHVVGSAITAADGSVSIIDTPTVATKYRLRVEHTTTTPAGVSRSLEVVLRPTTAPVVD